MSATRCLGSAIGGENRESNSDCDRDGFGDEAQDPLIAPVASCRPIAPDSIAPNARIEKGPKKRIKTRKPRAAVKIRFSSDDPGSSFECKLDKEAYKPCGSPKRYRIKATVHLRKHTFSVRSIDVAGNVDPTPATRTFKVKRLRRPAGAGRAGAGPPKSARSY